jgi:phospholipid/cholesterol/gamma-HCH transport system ATP-binding protein
MSTAADCVLELRGLKRRFGSKIVHEGVDLQLRGQELLALFGGSGTGKSLILRSIIGLEEPDAGQILWHGRTISGLREREWIEVRKKIAYVFQNGALFDSLTVYENLAYPLREHTKLKEHEIRARVAEMLTLVDMPGSENLLPGELSGGMQKRAGLARAMILGPEILLFDEPTAGLDPVNTTRFVQNILDLKKRGLTGIFVTHDIASALAVADRIAILHQGRIHCIETIETIRSSRDPVVRRFLFPEEST